MAQDATGTPTAKGIPKFNTAVDPPSGKGSNAQMDAIDALLTPTAVVATIIDAKGDILAGTANDTIARVAIGTDGFILTADAASTPGLKWAAAAAAGISVYDRVTADTDVVSSVAEVTLYTKTIVANDLSTNKKLRLTIDGDMLYNNNTVDTLNIKFKFGATTVIATGVVVPNGAISATRRAWKFLVEVANRGVTNAQLMSVFGNIGGTSTFVVTGTGNYEWPTTSAASGKHLTANGTAAEDTTANKDLVVTAQWSASSANNSFRLRGAILELV